MNRSTSIRTLPSSLCSYVLCPLLVALAWGLPGCTAGPGSGPDLILHNAALWTVNEAQPWAEAVAIREGRIEAVGDAADILALQGRNTEVIDLGGDFMVPGFNDTHIHFASAARFLAFNIMRTSTQEAFVDKVKGVVDALPPGEWILGGFWGAYDQWAAGSAGGEAREPFVPDMARIEALTKDHPMLIRKFDNSLFAANAAALRAAGIDPEAPGAAGVTFHTDADGAFTGILSGEGVRALFDDVVPTSFSRERRLSETRNALAEIRRFGVTSVSDMSDDLQLDLYRTLHDAGELTARIHFRYPLDRWGELAAQGIRIGSGDAWIRLGALKGHIDGIMGTSSARFFEPYDHDPNNYGRWRRLMVDEQGQFVEGQFLQYMLDADAAGLQLTIHAIGDHANALLMDYLEYLNEENGPKDRRFRLVHAQVIAPEDFTRMGNLGIIAEVQPYHLSDDMRWMEERIGTARSRGAYAFKQIQDSGALLAFGSDWPGTSASEYPINPMLGLYAAVSRQTVNGDPPGGWFPNQRITLAEAIKAYTLNPAYATFEEDLKGSIEVGKQADLTVLDRNLFDVPVSEYLEAQVRYTLIEGKVVYRAQP